MEGEEVRNAVLADDDGFSIDHRGTDFKALERSGDARHASGPIMPSPGIDADLAAIDDRDRPVAVMLDLVQPIRTPRGLAHRGRDGRRDPCRGKIEEAGLPEIESGTDDAA
jgi:hypothetical protein